ncbi:hypothetical protein [Escherichia coli]|uniref:hypothetical protein n=1 Tax=Escherichia coli TaxID=562 RepID=UPI00388E8C4C
MSLSIDAATAPTLDREVTCRRQGTSAVNLINGSGKPVRYWTSPHTAPDRIQVSTLPDGVETYGVWGLCRHCAVACSAVCSIRENGRHLCHHGGYRRVPEETIVDNGARFDRSPVP